MSKYLGMTNDEILALKGLALKEAASDLQISGRSKMKVDELRVAVHVTIMGLRKAIESTEPIATFVVPAGHIHEADDRIPETATARNGTFIAPIDHPFPPQLSMPEECAEAEPTPQMIEQSVEDIPAKEEDPELDTWQVLPNRAERRAAAKRRRKAAGRVAQKHNH
jgi:hypothetical protein